MLRRQLASVHCQSDVENVSERYATRTWKPGVKLCSVLHVIRGGFTNLGGVLG
jgi:hypothetical protein